MTYFTEMTYFDNIHHSIRNSFNKKFVLPKKIVISSYDIFNLVNRIRYDGAR